MPNYVLVPEAAEVKPMRDLITMKLKVKTMRGAGADGGEADSYAAAAHAPGAGHAVPHRHLRHRHPADQ
jgi:hypothetical protein